MVTELRSIPVNAANGPLDRRLNDIGWGLLLMLTGLIWLVPTERVPEGAWLLGVAALRHSWPRSAGSGERICRYWRSVFSSSVRASWPGPC